MMKLTRKQIEQGLEAFPIETVLLGAASGKEKRLTAKQKAFAEEVAKGNTKAGAYRKAYNSKGKPETQSKNGQALAKNKAIETQIEAFRVALEAQKYQTPAHLRALTIHKLTEKALSADVPPAQQIKALELLGKITEVALFTERREVIQTSNPAEMREKFLTSIRLALSSQNAETIEANEADELLAELSGVAQPDDENGQHETISNDLGEGSSPDQQEPEQTSPEPEAEEPPAPSQKVILSSPPIPHPQNQALADTSLLHSIPHNGSQPESPVTQSGVTPVTPENVANSTTSVSSSRNPMLSGGEGS